MLPLAPLVGQGAIPLAIYEHVVRNREDALSVVRSCAGIAAMVT